jgi:hypothetical protein
MHNPQPKNFTWLFLATYADAGAPCRSAHSG